MKYRRLPGLLNFKKLNHRISIKDSPFYFVDRLQDWKILEDEKKQAIPRRAGVSSFGYGGTNAHVILEEAPGFSKRAGNTNPGYLICLSAKTRSALRRKEEDLLCWLEERGQENHLADLSMTLGLGREHFDVRSAFVVKTARELKEKIKQILSEGKPEGYLQTSHSVKGDLMRPFFAELGRTIVEKICSADFQSEKEYSDKLKALAELYVNGYNPDWKMIFPGKGMNRLHLPTYPFARERHWIPAADTGTLGTKTTGEHTPAVLHPLLHQNTSDFNEQRFSSTFTAGMFSRTGQIVKGQRILPRVTCLEMARAAVERSTCDLEDNRNVFRLKNVLWTRDVALEEKATQVHIRLFLEDNGQITYEIYSDSIAGDGSPTMHGQGKAELGSAVAPPVLDIAALQAQCRRDAISAGQFYEAFSAMGIEYGTALRVIGDIHLCAKRALVRIALPSSLLGGSDGFLLLLRMLDVAVQASIGMVTGADQMNMASGASVPLSPLQPISLDELEILDGLEAAMWGIVRYSAGSRSDNIDPLEGNEFSLPLQQKIFRYRISRQLLPELSDTQGVLHEGS